jgi:glycine/D-amino acid oxidase-like deaminating enzyme
MTEYQTDLVIIGGGVAGLWLLNRLCSAGYNTVLLEQTALGSGQTIASQGMIHGGMKYALGGKLTGASESIADMPAHWKACLAGEGDVDLRNTRLLSDAYYLWPKESLRSRLNAFVGSKAVRGKVTNVDSSEWPAFFKGHINGPLYRLHDIVLDVPSLLANLAENCRLRIFRVEGSQLAITGQADAFSVRINPQLSLRTRRVICTAGQGNQALLEQSGIGQISMQRRPLQMVVVRHEMADPLYVHCISDQLTATPELTVTTHPCRDGKVAWYLGGELAEAGATLDPSTQIAQAREKLGQLFPWCDFKAAEWHSFFIDRAEAKQPGGKRPDNCSIESDGGLYFCWPTKLTLAPNLANRMLVQLQDDNFHPASAGTALPADLPFPAIATPPWEFA